MAPEAAGDAVLDIWICTVYVHVYVSPNRGAELEPCCDQVCQNGANLGPSWGRLAQEGQVWEFVRLLVCSFVALLAC